MNAPFAAIQAHGFVRAAVATPVASAGDVAFNVDQTIALAREGDARGCDLIVFPELNLSSYAIDDLHTQEAFLDAVEAGIARLCEATKGLSPVLMVGAGLRRNGRLYNCALALHRGRILGVVPKIFLPNYREYYEKRWFVSGLGLDGLSIRVAGQEAPFGADLLFGAEGDEDVTFHIEICEDYWAPTPPSTMGALAGATILCNLSASNITIGKADERKLLSAAQSMRCAAAYVFSAAGPGESTTDLAWDGQGSIFELGELLCESSRFGADPELAIADIDVQRLRQERLRMPTFNDAAAAAGHPERRFRRIAFDRAKPADIGFERRIRRFPYVPDRPEQLDQDCYEAFNIQVQGLAKRFTATSGKHLVIGVSGGLDSTHALIVAAKACDYLSLPRSTILGFTMPGFATGTETKANAWKLMDALGIVGEEIDIRPAAEQMLKDMGHPYSRGEPVYDVTFENVQAGLRTDYLFRLANQRGGFVVGTGDLSELALGWCTYGVGDHMSHYGVNAGVPKTLIQYLVRWAVRSSQFDRETDAVLEAILATKISPELVPADAEGAIQSTEDAIGPYELHDFFLYHILRSGQPPSKVAFLALQAWADAGRGLWPIDYPDHLKRSYDLATIRKWLEVFLKRFFGMSQFKRSALPNSPKVSAGGALSPRGDWRAPSDGTAGPWLDELRSAFD
ncbi:NAD(+) synthase [Allosphingosinicella indica]|uniref:Glutamine-dependent NAD(+) synthetase n=1 Tax=Allosphingosinicella indica TaxID=941907 RepID=A0A1X7G7P3_9SPHN|nr:NAD(+) synthase [Allosphingosinicella indica]SMF65446.1 NAD+ synthase (glutamine-hydrolysing) [Allosphingosinicella indica]